MTAITTDESPARAAVSTAVRPTLGDQFLVFFTMVLGGYAIGSKGFAYLGVGPVYVGEVSLLLGVVALWYSRSMKILVHLPLIRLVLLFMVFGALRTVPYLRAYRLDAL